MNSDYSLCWKRLGIIAVVAVVLACWLGDTRPAKPKEEPGEPSRAAHIIHWLLDSPDGSAADKIASKVAGSK